MLTNSVTVRCHEPFCLRVMQTSQLEQQEKKNSSKETSSMLGLRVRIRPIREYFSPFILAKHRIRKNVNLILIHGSLKSEAKLLLFS